MMKTSPVKMFGRDGCGYQCQVIDPQFESQKKIKLTNVEVKGKVESLVNEHLNNFLEENPAVAKKIVAKSLDAQRARIAARKARN